MNTKLSSENTQITIIYDELEQDDGAKSVFDKPSELVRRVGKLDSDKLAQNLNSFCQEIGRIFEGISTSINDYELDRFELVVEVTASGQIQFIGSVGGQVKGGLKLMFARHNAKE